MFLGNVVFHEHNHYILLYIYLNLEHRMLKGIRNFINYSNCPRDLQTKIIMYIGEHLLRQKIKVNKKLKLCID